MSSALLASTDFKVAAGILANAALSGANTVMLDAEFSVSTRPAALTAATSVDRTGLAEAAVATGAVDIPVKLPAPLFGTDAQAGPKSAVVAAPEPPPAVADAIGDEDEAAGAADEDVLELQAAVVRARPAAIPETARRRYFTVVLPCHG